MLHESAQRIFPDSSKYQGGVTGNNSAARDEFVPDTTPGAPPPTPPGLSSRLITQTLENLAARILQGPGFISRLPKVPYVTLAQNTGTADKIWEGVVTLHGVSLCWGKEGTRGTVKHIRLDQCQKSNPALELKKRVFAKLNKGYQIIPHYTKLP